MNRRLGVLAVVVVLLQSVLYLGYFTDDSYIYATFARNLAEHGELVFQLGERVHAATSPLWAALAAVAVRAGVDAADALKVLGVVAGIGAAWFHARWVGRRFTSGPLRAAVLLVLVTEPWFLRWSNSGMETPLAVLLLASLLDAGLREQDEVAWRRLAWSAGILPLVRPEALLLLGLVGARVLLTPGARRRPAVWIGLLLPMTVWSAIALPFYGSILPATLKAKSTPLGLVPLRLFHNLKVLAALLAIGGGVCVAAWAAGLPGAVRRRGELDGGQWLRPVIWAWSLALPVVYLLRDVQVVSRYLELVLPCMILLGAEFLARRSGPRRAAALLFVQAGLAVALSVLWIAPSARAFGRSLDQGVGDLAAWLRENSDEDAVVAVYDIGLMGYRSGRRILDLGGLTHPGLNELRNQLDDDDILVEGHFLDFGAPDYLVDRDLEAAALDGRRIREVTLRALLSREVANLGLSRGDPVWYTLYRLER